MPARRRQCHRADSACSLGYSTPQRTPVVRLPHRRSPRHCPSGQFPFAEAVADFPAGTFTLTVLRPLSKTNTTVCGPAETCLPAIGVDPTGLPSRRTLATGTDPI